MTAGTTIDFHFDEALRERGVTGAIRCCWAPIRP